VIAGFALSNSIALIVSLSMFSVFGSMVCAIISRRIK
jgi:hypothetical protein